jgi:hypothetical protein
MSDQIKTGSTRSAQRAAWQRPELRCMSAGAAEANPAGATDAAVLVS